MLTNKNLLETFINTVNKKGSATAVKFKDSNSWQELSWDELYQRVISVTSGLSKLGIQKGDRVCIFSKTSYQWTIADMAILSCGAISVPIYETNLPSQAEYILNNSEAKVVFVSDENQYKKILSIKDNLTHLEQIIFFSAPVNFKSEDGVYSWEELVLLADKESGEKVFQKNLEEIFLEDHATYVYTSGTTGPPKGVIMTHGNILTETNALSQVLDFSGSKESLLFLPLAHILARVVQFTHLEIGFVQAYAESIDKLLDNIQEAKPHVMVCVPRIFEKVHTRVMQGLENASESKKKIFNWALEIGKKRSSYILRGKRVSIGLNLKWKLAYKLVFSKLHEKMGGRMDFFISGGAPLSKDIGDFFQAAGFYILEGYGLTETCAAVTVNTKTNLKIGTVGKAIPGAEIKIAEDGEILLRGGMVFPGYYKNEEATEEVLEKNGWFHSGDIGEIDSQGFLKITDRKKDIIVTAGGKNIAPQNIENLMKTDSYISQIMVHGDKRKFLSALVTLDKDEIISFAKKEKISYKDYSDLVKKSEVYHLIKSRIDEKNSQLAKYETIKKFAILKDDFSIESGELTPTLKVKRKFTSEKYKHIIDGFYRD